MAKKNDCRAISEDFLEKFKPNGKFAGFIELVKKHPELCLCFRGNSNAVEIYINNHRVFMINESEKVDLGFKLARYSEKWGKYAKTLSEKYHFKINQNSDPIIPNDKSQIDYLHCYKNENIILTKENIETIYVDILKPIISDYFSPDKTKDWFRDYNRIDYSKKSNRLEKRKQQLIFSSLKNTQDGYFIYDLEFNQQFSTKAERKAEKEKNSYSNNKPDALAIKFENGKPKKLAFIEIKSKADALDGSSGIENHINGMISYNQGMYERRCKEAYRILDQYQKIGLYNLEKYDINDSENLKKEILLIFTDDAITEWEKDSYKQLREKTKKIPIKLKDCIIYRYEE